MSRLATVIRKRAEIEA